MVQAAIAFSGRPASAPPPVWVFLLLFTATWLLVAFFLSRFSGWTRLAEYYRCERPWSLLRFQSAQFRRSANYNGCLNFAANYEGLYMAPMLPFRTFHAPLLIPWTEITARPVKLWRFWNFVELRFQRAPDVPVRIRASLAQKLTDTSSGRFHDPSPAPTGI